MSQIFHAVLDSENIATVALAITDFGEKTGQHICQLISPYTNWQNWTLKTGLVKIRSVHTLDDRGLRVSQFGQDAFNIDLLLQDTVTVTILDSLMTIMIKTKSGVSLIYTFAQNLGL